MDNFWNIILIIIGTTMIVIGVTGMIETSGYNTKYDKLEKMEFIINNDTVSIKSRGFEQTDVILSNGKTIDMDTLIKNSVVYFNK